MPRLPRPLDAARADVIFPQNAAAFHHSPARCLEGGIDVFGAGLDFDHGVAGCGDFIDGIDGVYNPVNRVTKVNKVISSFKSLAFLRKGKRGLAGHRGLVDD